MEKKIGYCLKTLHTDRGGEFTSNKFDSYCKINGIQRQLTTSYTPQQNGIVKYQNRTIFEMARSMMKGKTLPNIFWAEAVATSIYLLNRCPIRSLQNITSYEAWCGRKPNISHLRVFGCIVYAHVPSFDDKSVKYIFIGYCEETKGYRLYNLETEKLMISCDVLFDEKEEW